MLLRKKAMTGMVAGCCLICFCMLPCHAAPVIEQPPASSGFTPISQNERPVVILPVSQSSVALSAAVVQNTDTSMQKVLPIAMRDGNNNIALHSIGGVAIQTGRGNDAAMVQGNACDEALIVQTGSANTAIIRQNGTGLSAADANHATIQQTGNNFTASITQTGMQNRGLIVQR